VPELPKLAEPFAVITCHDDQRTLELTFSAKMIYDPTDLFVHVSHAAVVDVLHLRDLVRGYLVLCAPCLL
jgi:hypothetical protein